MPDTSYEELTRADIKRIAASIYEPLPRIWANGYWRCPQCHAWNENTSHDCACGISRDGLPEFCQGKAVDATEYKSEEPKLLQGAVVLIGPALLVWGAVLGAIKLWKVL